MNADAHVQEDNYNRLLSRHKMARRNYSKIVTDTNNVNAASQNLRTIPSLKSLLFCIVMMMTGITILSIHILHHDSMSTHLERARRHYSERTLNLAHSQKRRLQDITNTARNSENVTAREERAEHTERLRGVHAVEGRDKEGYQVLKKDNAKLNSYHKDIIKEEELVRKYPDLVKGHYSPCECSGPPCDCPQTEKTAIIIPYRDRFHHLLTLMPVLIPMLIKQEIDFTIFIVEQELPTSFNKGVILNAGYTEALKRSDFDCFIFHDVDMLPRSDKNFYRCNKTSPVHFMAGVNKFKYSLLYEDLVGGVIGFTREQYKIVNGYSNLYFGWGAEDDDMGDRIRHKGLNVTRKMKSVGLYDMIRHRRDKRWSENKERHMLRNFTTERMDVDGVNSVKYKLIKIEEKPLYVWITISVNMTEVFETAPSYMWSIVEANKMADYYRRIVEGTARELPLPQFLYYDDNYHKASRNSKKFKRAVNS